MKEQSRGSCEICTVTFNKHEVSGCYEKILKLDYGENGTGFKYTKNH